MQDHIIEEAEVQEQFIEHFIVKAEMDIDGIDDRILDFCTQDFKRKYAAMF